MDGRCLRDSGFGGLDIGKEVEEEPLPFGNEKSQLGWFRYLMRTNPLRGVLEGLHYISYLSWGHFSPQRGKYCEAEGDLT